MEVSASKDVNQRKKEKALHINKFLMASAEGDGTEEKQKQGK